MPLALTGLSFSGANPGDFVLDWSQCLGGVAPGQSCQLGVSFAPQGQGARSAVLAIATNDYANSPMQTTLSGTGGALPAGPLGATGPAGPAGPRGNPGSPGKVEVVTCKTVTVKVKHRAVHRQKCVGRLVSGPVTSTTAGTHASLVRGPIVYARGTSVSLGHGRSQVALSDLRPVRPGRYTLVARRRHGGRWTSTRTAVTIN